MSSIACYDVASVGLKTLLLCPTVQVGSIHSNWYADLVDEGYVQKASVDLKIIEEWVKSVELSPQRLSNLSNDVAWRASVDWMLEKSGLNKKSDA